jgi:hypothetical protein
VLALLILVVLGVVAVNAFGAWAVSRRKPRVAGLFLLGAVGLVVAAAALGYGLRFAVWILAGGLLLTWLASYLNARWVLGRVVGRPHHGLRATTSFAPSPCSLCSRWRCW